MTERFSNQAVTTLSAAITTTTATSCTVTDVTTFPTAGNFRIKIDAEILIVTTVAANAITIKRGAEGTVAATHASAASVIHLLTKGSMEARVANRFISDLYANKPAAGVKGRLFFPTDGLFLEYDDGAAWHQYGPYRRLKAPPQTGWTWVNQGNATVTYTGSALILEEPDLGTGNPQLRCLVRPLSVSGATTITAAFTWNGIGSDTPCMGFCARDVGGTSDGHFAGWGVRIQGSGTCWWLHYKYYSSPTAIENTPTIDGRYLWAQRLFWVRQELAGTYKRFYWSADGVNWIKWIEDSYSNYNTPSQFGIFIDPTNNTQKVSLSLVHWEEV